MLRRTCVLACALLSVPALAQEAAPIPLALGLSPDTGLPVVIRARDAGLLVAGADGRFTLVCAGALGVSSNANFYIQGRAGGGFLVSTYEGLTHADADACDWTFPEPELENVNVADVDRHGDVLHVLVANGQSYSVFRSDDAGETFAEAFALPDGPAFIRLRAAPSMPGRFYLTAATTDLDAGTVERWIYRTDDDGATFMPTPIDQGDEPIVDLLAVDPQDPGRLYLAFAQRLSSHSHGDEPAQMDRLVFTEDDGATLQTLREVHLFGGFAVGAADGELWLGDAEGGLLRSTDRGEAFQVVDDALHVSCIERNDERIWVCADSVQDAFSVGYSDDLGESFTPFMRFDEVTGVHECDGAPLACGPQWSGWQFWHPGSASGDAGGPDASMPALDAGAVTAADASTPTATATDESGSGGCGCRLGGGPGAAGALPFALALLWLRRRRR